MSVERATWMTVKVVPAPSWEPKAVDNAVSPLHSIQRRVKAVLGKRRACSSKVGTWREERVPSVAAVRKWASAHEPSSSHDDADPGIVRRAAAVLEEELAASPLRDPPATPLTGERTSEAQGPREAVPALNAFRQSLLQLLGEFQAVVEGAPAHEDQSPPIATAPDTRRPVLAVSQCARAGDIAELRIGLVNDSQTAATDVELSWTHLVAGPADRIAESQITLQPHRLRLDPEQSTEVIVLVNLPPDTPSGTYIGLVRATRPADQVVIMTIHVV